jgi:hypothetical protein
MFPIIVSIATRAYEAIGLPFGSDNVASLLRAYCREMGYRPFIMPFPNTFGIQFKHAELGYRTLFVHISCGSIRLVCGSHAKDITEADVDYTIRRNKLMDSDTWKVMRWDGSVHCYTFYELSEKYLFWFEDFKRISNLLMNEVIAFDLRQSC